MPPPVAAVKVPFPIGVLRTWNFPLNGVVEQFSVFQFVRQGYEGLTRSGGHGVGFLKPSAEILDKL